MTHSSFPVALQAALPNLTFEMLAAEPAPQPAVDGMSTLSVNIRRTPRDVCLSIAVADSPPTVVELPSEEAAAQFVATAFESAAIDTSALSFSLWSAR